MAIYEMDDEEGLKSTNGGNVGIKNPMGKVIINKYIATYQGYDLENQNRQVNKPIDLDSKIGRE